MAFLKNLNGIDAASLGVFPRVLLVTDGTLTDTVEALTGEPIGLRKVALEIRVADGSQGPLEVERGDPLMHRKIVLYGQTTGRNYVYAESDLALHRLPAGFREALVSTDVPLGRLWTQYRIETWKELLDADLVESSAISEHLESDEGLLVRRQYRMISGGAPLMVITEYFPAR